MEEDDDAAGAALDKICFDAVAQILASEGIVGLPTQVVILYTYESSETKHSQWGATATGYSIGAIGLIEAGRRLWLDDLLEP